MQTSEEEHCLRKVKSWLKPRLSDFLKELLQPHNCWVCNASVAAL